MMSATQKWLKRNDTSKQLLKIVKLQAEVGEKETELRQAKLVQEKAGRMQEAQKKKASMVMFLYHTVPWNLDQFQKMEPNEVPGYKLLQLGCPITAVVNSRELPGV